MGLAADVWVFAFPLLGTPDLLLGQEVAAELKQRGVAASAWTNILLEDFAREGLTTTDVIMEASRRAMRADCVVVLWSARTLYASWMLGTVGDVRHKAVYLQTDSTDAWYRKGFDLDLRPWVSDHSQSQILDALVPLIAEVLAKPKRPAKPQS